MASIPPPSSRAGWIEIDLARLVASDDLAGREDEWLRVYRHFNPRLESFFAGRFRTRLELDGFLADVWRRAFLNISTVRSSKALWSWLTTIGNNLLRDRFRRDRTSRQREVLWADAEGSDRLRVLIAGWARDDGDEGVRGVERLKELTEEEREFLELYAIDGLNHEEIAETLQLKSAAASRQRLRRLRLRFTESQEES